jgi:3-hydroxyethyl bacteriochlorophyllide a dehydrogenase
VRGLFGGAASRVVVPAQRVVPVSEQLGEQAVLLALAATAYHAVAVRRQARTRSSRRTSSSATACSAACWRA